MENNLNLTLEMLEKAKTASSATALLTLAQENGIALTAEEAATYYTRLHPELGALSDEELDNVSGGGWCPTPQPGKCICGRRGKLIAVQGDVDIYKCACGLTWNVDTRNK